MTNKSVAQSSSDNQFQGAKYAQQSLISAIIGFFVLGFILGPVAIILAGRAERLGVPATFGKVLGWIDTILWILGLVAGVIAAIFILPNIGSN